MGRETARKMEVDANMAFTNVQRNDQGVVQMTSVTSLTGFSTTGTTTVTTTVTTVTGPVCFESAVIGVNGGGGGNAATANLLRNGSTITSVSSTGGSTTAFSPTTPTEAFQSPLYELKLSANGGSATASVTTLSRNNRWA